MRKPTGKTALLSHHTAGLWALVAAIGLMSAISAIIVGHAQTQQQQPPPDPRPRRVEPQRGGPPTLPTPTPTPNTVPNPSKKDEDGEVDPGETITVDTSNVVLNVRVIDRNNRPINNVRREEFHVFENGVSQPVLDVSRAEVPISYGLAIDSSGSLRSQMTQVIDAAKSIVNSNKPGDETFLLRFIDQEKIETLQDFTSNKDDLMDAVDRIYVEGGQTDIIDAVYLAAEHVAEYKKNSDADRRRRALILVTDGENRNSYYPTTQLFDRLKEADVQIYVIGFVNELDSERGLIRKSKKEQAMALLDRFASETGGRVFYPKSLSELPGIANEITRDMRTQYVVTYDPTNKKNDGTYRAIKVSIDDAPGKDKRIALTRSGRTAPREGGPRSQPPAGQRSSKMSSSGRATP
jgi:Ca-activated chloride channel family protein